MMALLKLKLDHWKKLPWLLCGLAHSDESVGRRIGQEALEQFSRDPRAECHHRLTWQLLQPGSEFRTGLDDFLGGSPLHGCNRLFQEQVATFRFMIIVETTVESKHARVSAVRRAHAVGPVKVSLANRMPLLERWLKRKHVQVIDVVQSLSGTRTLPRAASLLNLDNHPAMRDVSGLRRGGPAAMHPVLASVLYNCDMDSMFKPQKEAAATDRTAKRKRAATELRLTGARTHRHLPKFHEVEKAAMIEHLITVLSMQAVYKCPRTLLDMQPLSTRLDEPNTKRQRTLSVDTLPDHDITTDVAEIAQDVVGGDVHFKLVLANPSKKKLLKPAIGIGGRVCQGEALVTVHEKITGFGDTAVIRDRPASGHQPDPTFILGAWRVSNAIMKENLCRYAETHTLFSLSNFTPPPDSSDMQVCELVGDLLRIGGHPGGGDGLGLATPPLYDSLVFDLHSHQLIEPAGDRRWKLTALGV